MKNLLLALTLLVSFSSKATLIDLEFDKSEYLEGDTITGQLIASDFNETLGSFSWADISFDDTKLQLNHFAFGDGFDDGFGSVQIADDTMPGLLSLSDFSFMFASEAVLAAKQGVSFVLATFEFSSLAQGDHTVSLLDGVNISNFANTSLEILAGTQANFSVRGATPVPTPVTVVLFLSGLFMLRKKLV